MTYRAWEQKPLDRTAVRELTAAIAEQAAAQLEEQAMDEAPWSDALFAQAHHFFFHFTNYRFIFFLPVSIMIFLICLWSF